METGTHIPSYLMCERFAKNGVILDLFPIDEQGVRILAPTAAHAHLVYSQRYSHLREGPANLHRTVARMDSLPFQKGSFDLVLHLNLPLRDPEFDFEAHVRACRHLINPSGLVAFMVPNRENRSSAVGALRKIPDFMDLERLLRRHFPHIMMFSQQPLFGATLSPIGRRPAEDAPLLDDRMIPEGGEIPEYYVALCSTKYQRLDDTTIAQLPFKPLAESIRLQTEKYEGTIDLVQKEKDLRDKEIRALEERLADFANRLGDAEQQTRDRAALAGRVTVFSDQIQRKDAEIRELETRLDEKTTRAGQLEDDLLSARRSVRRLEQQVSDLERNAGISARDRDEHEFERTRLISTVHDLQAELKLKQREIDDFVEQIAERESELDTLRRESVALRKEIASGREQNRLLDIRTHELETDRSVVTTLEVELERTRALALAERKRLEQQIDEERAKILEEAARKEDARRETHTAELRIQELMLSIETQKTQLERQKQNMDMLTGRIDKLETERRQLLDEIRQSDQSAEEVAKIAHSRSDEVERLEHSISVLTARTKDAESRAEALQLKLTELHQALTEMESENAELRQRLRQIPLLEERYQKSVLETDRLQKEIARLENECHEVSHRSDKLDQVEERHRRSMSQIQTLTTQLAGAEDRIAELELQSLRAEQLENRHRTAIEQVDALQKESETLRRELEILRPEAGVSVNFRIRAEAAEGALLSEKHAHGLVRKENQEARQRIAELESDLRIALSSLAETEEGAEIRVQDAVAHVQQMRDEILRLKSENETELLCVREDLETELRHALRQLEARQSEIWELSEQVLRLQAQSLASAAASRHEGVNVDFQKTLLEQETLINSLTEDREKLRRLVEDQKQSLEVRKKNLRILAALLKRERQDRGEEPEVLAPSESVRTFDVEADEVFDIESVIENDRGQLSADFTFLENHDPLPARKKGNDDAIVDAIMESVVIRHSLAPGAPPLSPSIPPGPKKPGIR